ncbi:armadillo-type protein [Irpex rosettiformis]|uniref:Armadillo-type protein n=1 Tax=Irpex rosettiformis TaxID=378272 RepID=A0ACB8UGR1_9APHY|nr:armadillo-type protein [Irpex rosettiformis]
MGILLSFLFPYNFMNAEQPASSSSSSTSSSTADAELEPPDIPLPQPALDSPAAEDTAERFAFPDNASAESTFQIAETRSYNPHVLGLGLSSLRTSLGTSSNPPLTQAVTTPPPEVGPSSHPMQCNPFEVSSETTGARTPGSPASGPGSLQDDPESLPPPLSLSAQEEEPVAVSLSSVPTEGHSGPSPTTAGGSGGGGLSLHLEIPPSQHHPGNPFVHSGLAFSSPPLAITGTANHQQEPPVLAVPSQGTHGVLDIGQELPFGPNAAAPVNDAALNLDFAEFDLEGLSTLEKIYLFSRSRAGFQRVFIAHALPGFLQSGFSRHKPMTGNTSEDASAQNESPNEVDEIAPAEAVEYVLPLLNGLAMDDDEAVKEALAAELVPIIWWFITHCQLVEDEPQPAFDASTGASSTEPTQISVQAFTPILGTLLLSSDGLVGGPARYAVVELLSRVRRADERDARHGERERSLSKVVTITSEEPQMAYREEDPSGTSLSQPEEHESDDGEDGEDGYSPIGLFGPIERRLFEREMIYQIVVGMGRLDLPEETAFEEQVEEEHIPDTTAMPTPHASIPNRQHGNDSYFPPMDPIPDVPEAEGVGSSTSTDGTSFVEETNSTSPGAVSTLETGSPSSTPSLTSTSSSIDSTPASTTAVLTPSPTPSLGSSEVRKNSPFVDSPKRMPLQFDFGEDWRPVATSRPLSPRPRSPGIDVARSMSPGPGSSAFLVIRSSPRPSSPAPLIARPPSPIPPSPLTRPQPQLPNPSMEGVGVPRSSSPPPLIISPIPEPAPGLLHPAFAAGEDMGGLVGTPPEEYTGEGEITEEIELSEEASVGRLSSMSLMAAVTASGPIDDETKNAFVAEIERVGRDPVYWVRREASFAVGALAKVVPQEVVLVSLLPLFEDLYRDSVWDVRHSALFALPAILSRLPPQHRRTLALDVILTLANDESMTVRSGVLEALAEVIYTFHEDAERPPDKLLKLFLGVREDDDSHSTEHEEERGASPTPSLSWSDFVASVSSGTNDGPEPDIYDDPSRPLVCAFNLPAVALTVGRERWSELRELYHTLSHTPSFKVRRTLAASLGEIAKIIGPEQAHKDLMPIWWASVRSDEGDIRLRVLEASVVFVATIGPEDRKEVLIGLEEKVWPLLKGWRERDTLLKALPAFAAVENVDETTVWSILRKSLVDPAAVVRETAVSTLPALLKLWASRMEVIQMVWTDVLGLATSSSYRQRMTFLACHQAILQSDLHGGDFLNGKFLETLSLLSEDPIVDVRLRVARLLGAFSVRLSGLSVELSNSLHDLANKLGQDPSSDVKSFAEPLIARWPPVAPHRQHAPAEVVKKTANFSRPPPPTIPELSIDMSVSTILLPFYQASDFHVADEMTASS